MTCPYRTPDSVCIEPEGHLGAHTLAMVDEPPCNTCGAMFEYPNICICEGDCEKCHPDPPPLDPLPPLRWCQHCGDDIGGQGRRICRMCAADVAEREEHRDED